MLYSKKILVSKSNIEEKGIFAKRDIRKGEVIFIFKGKKKEDKYDKERSKIGQNWLGFGENIWLDPKNDSFGRYINHSCDPNAGIKGKVTFVAMRKIKKGEEITFDYSISEADPYWRLDHNCRCGCKNCRKIIRSVESLTKDIFKRYLPYIPKFTQKVWYEYNK